MTVQTAYTLEQFLADTRATIKSKGIPSGLAEIRDHLEKLLTNPELLKKHLGDPVPYTDRTTIGHDPETDVHVRLAAGSEARDALAHSAGDLARALEHIGVKDHRLTLGEVRQQILRQRQFPHRVPLHHLRRLHPRLAPAPPLDHALQPLERVKIHRVRSAHRVCPMSRWSLSGPARTRRSSSVRSCPLSG